MDSKKVIRTNLLRNRLPKRENKPMATKWEKGEGINWEYWINRNTNTYNIDNRDGLCSTGNSIQYLIITIMEENLKRYIDIYICVCACVLNSSVTSDSFQTYGL